MTRLLALSFLTILVPIASLQAAIRSTSKKADGATLYTLAVEHETVAAVAREISALTHSHLVVDSNAATIEVSFVLADATPHELLAALAQNAKLHLIEEKDVTRLQLDEPTVTIDVKDEEVRTVLASVARQCGIENLMIDPEVQGRATFRFRDVPCTNAFQVVTRTFGLSGEIVGNVANVAPRR